MTFIAATPHRAIALPFRVHPRKPGGAVADLSGAELAHRALRTSTRLLADTAAAIADGQTCSPERHAAIVGFGEHVLYEVAEHHRKEDDILWPVIAASVGAEVDLDALSDECGVLQAVLARAEDALRVFAEGVGVDGLAAALSELADDLDAHITAEEASVFPVIRKHVSARDYKRVRSRSAKHNPWSHLLFVLSLFADQSGTMAASAAADIPLRARPGRRRRLSRWQRMRDLVAGSQQD